MPGGNEEKAGDSLVVCTGENVAEVPDAVARLPGDHASLFLASDIISLRKLRASGLEYVWLEDHVSLPERIGIRGKVSVVRSGWYDSSVLGFDLTYRGVALGELFENLVNDEFTKILKLACALRNVLLTKKPDRVVVLGEPVLVSVVATRVAGALGYPVQLIPRTKKDSNPSVRRRADTVRFGRLLVPRQLMRPYFWLSRLLATILVRPQARASRLPGVLFLNYNPTFFSLVTEELSRRGFQTFNLTDLPAPYPISKLITRRDSTHPPPGLSLPRTRDSKAYDNLWRGISTNRRLQSLFEYEGIDCWDAIEPFFGKLVRQLLPEVVGRIYDSVQLLKKFGIGCVVAWADVSPFEKSVMEAGRIANIPSVALQHGMMEHTVQPGHVPQSAQKIVVWGEHSRQMLLSGGIEDEDIEVLGWPHFDEYLNQPDVPEDKRRFVTLILPGLYAPADWSAIFRYDEPDIILHSFLEACRDLGLRQLLVKTRIPEDVKQVVDTAHRYSLNPVVTSAGLLECLRQSKIVVSYDSSVLVEAIVLDRPTICVVLGERSAISSLTMVRAGVTLLATSESALREDIKTILTDGKLTESRGQLRKKYLEFKMTNLGRATVPTVDLIERLTLGRQESASPRR